MKCPAFPWCVAPHDEDTNLHAQPDNLLPTTAGGDIGVSIFHDERTGPGVYVGVKELNPGQAIRLGKAIIDAAFMAMAAQHNHQLKAGVAL